MYNAARLIKWMSLRETPSTTVFPLRLRAGTGNPFCVGTNCPYGIHTWFNVIQMQLSRSSPGSQLPRNQSRSNSNSKPCNVDMKYVCPPPMEKEPKKKSRWWLWLLLSALMGMFVVANFCPEKMCEWKCDESPIYDILAPFAILRDYKADDEEGDNPGGKTGKDCKNSKDDDPEIQQNASTPKKLDK